MINRIKNRFSENKKNKNKGFTMVELVVVLVIIAIIISIAVAGIAAYMRYSKFKKNNEYARTVFVAAQSSLTHMKADGTLEDFQGKIEKIRDTHRVPASVAGSYENRLTYLMINGGSMDGTDADLMRGMLDNYLFDEDIWNASICIEFDPLDAVVYSVSYCAQADSFTYEGEAGSVNNGRMNICARDVKSRRKILLGYYSTELSAAAPEAYGKPVINKVRLDNEDVLDLNWQLTEKYKTRTSELAYNVRLFDSEGRTRMQFVVNEDAVTGGTSLTSKLYPGIDMSDLRTVECPYTTYDESGDEEESGKITFLAYVDTDYTVHIILDAVDQLAAALEADSYEGDAEYSATTSSMRLIEMMDLDADENIYAKVQAYGTNYTSSTWKKSDEENLLMGKNSSAKNNKFTIQNARHLFNLRFMESYKEDEDEDEEYIYVLTDSFAWGGEEGILSNKHVADTSAFAADNELFKTTQIVPEKDGSGRTAAFERIDELSKESTLTSDGSHTIDYLVIRSHETSPVYADDSKIGLFSENYGRIEKLKFDHVLIEGVWKDGGKTAKAGYVGTICGLNYGVLEDNTVAGGAVSGTHMVGGIAGYNGSLSDNQSGLHNGADVTGENKIGGIFGESDSYKKVEKNQKFSIADCENTGRISGTGMYIGGIVGYNKGYRISGCKSAVSIESPENIDESQLIGKYVGGIVGFDHSGIIEKCETGSGYILGSQYVGGIAGAVNSDAFDGGGMRNKATVIGKRYVGGILGLNSKFNGESSNPNLTKGIPVSNWINEGIVCATIEYAGGIVGYNSGTIERCYTDVDVSTVSGEELLKLAQKFGGSGNYAGGIAGYNRGTIDAGKATKVTSVVAGNRYVGGIAGLNSAAGVIKNYELAGGFISGKSFVGGYIGLNCSSAVFKDNEALWVNPNKVSGGYFVGGFAGGNIIQSDNKDNLTANINVDNFLGSVSASGAYAGGIIGYNALISSNGAAENKAEKMAEAVEASRDYTLAVQAIDSMGALGNQKGTMTLIAPDKEIVLNQVSAGLYAGGAVGYNDSKSVLTILDMTNKASVITTGYMDVSGARYAYAGGITGRVTAAMIIDNCRNGESVRITSTGTYAGGLAELNEGLVKNCSGSFLGSASRDNIGALIGMNKGQVQACELDGELTGRNNTGGIVSVNDQSGSISGITVSGKVTAAGTNAGGVAGINYGTITDVVLREDVTSSGDNVGGAVGYNAGSLSLCTMEGSIAVSGRKNVGGFIGFQENSLQTYVSINNLENISEVIAQENAGGIIGLIEGRVSVENCVNSGKVQAGSGYAGGIACRNGAEGRIYGCENTGEIYAPNALSIGAITGINAGTIDRCTAGGGIIMTGTGYIGGIAGHNEARGHISNSNIGKMELALKSGTKNSCVGGIAGMNDGIISASGTDGSSGKAELIISSNTSGSAAGGVAGINYGTISGNTAGTSTKSVRAQLKLLSGTSAYIGGIAGHNLNSIGSYIFTGYIEADGSDSYGIGGIAGVNGLENGGASASISNCFISDGRELTGMNSDTNSGSYYTIRTSNKTSAKVGGITGVNYENASIAASTLIHCYIRADYGYVGGIAGWNMGTISDCTTNTAARPIDPDNVEMRVKIYMYQGHLGGITGRNERYGSISDCQTGHDWFVLAAKLNNSNQTEATDDTAAGMIGYNCSDKKISGLTNYAKVTKALKASGGEAFIASGVIGRQENITSTLWSIEDCANYGTITGGIRVSGILAQWKYNGGILKNCTNYGNIVNNNIAVGGIVGDFYGLSKGQEAVVYQCNNFGEIGSQASEYAGGIVGRTNNNNNAAVIIANCNNIGAVTIKNSSANGAGIFGGNTTGTNVSVRQCVNYYRFSQNENHISSGISGPQATVTGSINVPANVRPIGNYKSGTTNKNYYFGPTVPGEPAYPIYPETVTSVASSPSQDSGAASHHTGMLFDGDPDSYWNYQWNSMKWQDLKLGIRIELTETSDKIDTIAINWRSNKAARTYSFILSYEDRAGDKYYLKNADGAITKDQAQAYRFNVVMDNKSNYVWYLKPANVIDAKVLNIEEIASTTKYVAINEIQLNNYEMLETEETLNNPDNTDARALYFYKDGNTYVAKNGYTGAAIKNLPYNPNDNTSRPGCTSYSAEQYYDDFHIMIEGFLRSQAEQENIVSPEKVTLSGKSGNYTASWSPVAGIYNYRVYVEIQDESGQWENYLTDMVDYGTQYTFSVDNAYSGRNMRIGIASVNGGQISGKTYSENIPVCRVLPMPKIVYELTDNQGNFICRLSNLAEYADFMDDAKNIFIQAEGDLGSIRFSLAEGKSALISDNNKAASTSTFATAQAVPDKAAESRYIESSKYSVQTQFYTADYLKKNSVSSGWTLNGFTGDTMDALAYKLMLKYVNTQVYRYTELLSGQTALASDLTRISSNQNIVLGGLSALSGGETVSIQSYPWGTQNLAYMFGHEVAAGVSEAELNGLTDSLKDNQSVWDGNGNLKNGYIAAKNSDGTYDVRYSTILAYKSDFSINYLSAKAQVPKAAEPVAFSENYTKADDSYTFSWSDPNGAGTYEVTVYGQGLNSDGSQKEEQIFDTVTEQNKVTLNAASWEYHHIKIEVVRRGTVNGSGATTLLPCSAEQTYGVEFYLPRVLNLTGDLDSQNELLYNLSWQGLEGVAYYDMAGYEVFAAYEKEGSLKEDKIAEADRTQTSCQVDLEAYAGKKTELYVKAVLNSGPSYYNQDSKKGQSIKLDIPERMQSSAQLSLDKDYDSSSLTTGQFINEGFTASAADDMTTLDGRYILKAAVYDADTVDEKGEPSGRLLYTVTANGSELLPMTNSEGNSLKSASYHFSGFPVALAGKYLFMKTRTTSGSSISSAWSGYKTVRLPKIKIDTPMFSESTTVRDYSFADQGESDTSVTVEQKAFSFSWDALAGKYMLDIEKISEGGTQPETHTISVESSPSGITVKADGATELLPDQNNITTDELGTTHYSYQWDGYKTLLSVKDGSGLITYDKDLPLYIDLYQTKDGKVTICVTLPDYNQYTLNPGGSPVTEDAEGKKLTKSITLRAEPEDTNNYEPSGGCQWARQYDDVRGEWGEGQIKEID